jgi:hypothetical protein
MEVTSRWLAGGFTFPARENMPTGFIFFCSTFRCSVNFELRDEDGRLTTPTSNLRSLRHLLAAFACHYQHLPNIPVFNKQALRLFYGIFCTIE